MLPDAQESKALDPSVVAIGLLGLPQVEAKTAHYFGPEIYIREITIPAGSFIVGQEHKTACMNVMLSGHAILFSDGSNKEVKAPLIVNSKPGAKMAYAITDVVWWNIHPNPDNETDIDVLEERYVNVPDWFKKYRAGEIDVSSAQAMACRSISIGDK